MPGRPSPANSIAPTKSTACSAISRGFANGWRASVWCVRPRRRARACWHPSTSGPGGPAEPLLSAAKSIHGGGRRSGAAGRRHGALRVGCEHASAVRPASSGSLLALHTRKGRLLPLYPGSRAGCRACYVLSLGGTELRRRAPGGQPPCNRLQERTAFCRRRRRSIDPPTTLALRWHSGEILAVASRPGRRRKHSRAV